MEKTFLIIMLWVGNHLGTKKHAQYGIILQAFFSIFEGKLSWKWLIEQRCLSQKYLWFTFQFIFSTHLFDKTNLKNISQFRQFLLQENNPRQLSIWWRHTCVHIHVDWMPSRVNLLKARAVIDSLSKAQKEALPLCTNLPVGN